MCPAAAPAGFAAWWAAYPGPRTRKKAKPLVAKKYAAAAARVGEDRLAAALAWWSRQVDWTKDGGQYVCAPLVWLNQELWDAAPEDDRPAACLAVAVKQFIGQPWYGLWSRSFEGFQDGDRCRLLLQQQQERGWRPDEDAFYRALDADDVAGAMAALWAGRIEVAS